MAKMMTDSWDVAMDVLMVVQRVDDLAVLLGCLLDGQ
jgi:hypothetical protein